MYHTPLYYQRGRFEIVLVTLNLKCEFDKIFDLSFSLNFFGTMHLKSIFHFHLSQKSLHQLKKDFVLMFCTN